MAVPAHDQRDWEFATQYRLIMGGDRHYRPGAKLHQDEVGDIDGYFAAGKWVNRNVTGGHALFLAGRQLGFGGAATDALIAESSQLGIVSSCRLGQWMTGSYRHIGDTHQCIGAGGIDAERLGGAAVAAFDIKTEFDASGFTNPVALHGLDLLGPLDLVEIGEQL